MLGIITGTGFYDLPALKRADSRSVSTPYGDVRVTVGMWHEIEVGFLPRHGTRHTIMPSSVNYRANLWGLHELGIDSVLSVCVVGSVDNSVKPGDIVVLDQFLDLTKGRRADTFFDREGEVRHTDMTYPYSERLRSVVLAAAADQGADVTPKGTYACFEGPRFESAAEAQMARLLGANVVGMTGYPEVALARELQLAFCALAVVSNFAPGIAGNMVSLEEVKQVTEAASCKLLGLLDRVVQRMADEEKGPHE